MCFLSCALGAKISKKVEKPSSNGNADKAEPAAAAAAQAAEGNNEKNEDEEADDEDEEEDEDDDEEEEKETGAEKQPSADKVDAVAATATGNKNELQPAVDPTDLSVWGMVRTLWSWLRSDLSESLFGDDDDEKPAAVGGE